MPGKHNAGGCGCCECECSYSHGFTYSESTCFLSYTLTNLCGDIVETDIDVVITGPDGVDATAPTISGNTYTWRLYKPTPGDWEASVNISCPGDELVYLDEITVDSGYDCDDCCFVKTPYTMTVDSSASCCSFGNGTYVLISDGSGSCSWRKVTTIFSRPSDPCIDTPCFTLSQVHLGVTQTYFFYRASIQVSISLDGVFDPYPIGSVIYSYYAYRVVLVSGVPTCVAEASSSSIIQYNYRFNCENSLGTPIEIGADPNGRMAWVGGTSGEPAHPVIYDYPCGTSSPTVSVDFL